MSEQDGRTDTVAELIRDAGPRTPVPAAVAARVHAATRAAWQSQVRTRRTRRVITWSGAALAASLVIALGVRMQSPTAELPTVMALRVLGPAQLLHDDASRPWREGERLPVGATLITGEAGALALGVGRTASLRVAPDSRVRYAADGGFELERGAVYFDSGSAANVRLLVRTPYGEVQHVGTQYEAALVDGALRVRVREGRVQVDGVDAPLSAGVELHLDGADARYTRIATDGRAWDWAVRVAPPLAIDGASVDTYLGWVARESGLSLEFASPEVRAAAGLTRLQGSLPEGTPLSTLDALLPATSFEHRLQAGTLRIDRAKD